VGAIVNEADNREVGQQREQARKQRDT
jgi:hypothetical protein